MCCYDVGFSISEARQVSWGWTTVHGSAQQCCWEWTGQHWRSATIEMSVI